MALTLGNFVGFETGGLEEATSTSGAPDVQDSVVRTGDYALKLPGAATAPMYGAPANFVGEGQAEYFAVGFAIYINDLTPTADVDFCYAWESELDEVPIRLRLKANGDLKVVNANNVETGSASSPFEVNTWHYIEMFWRGHSTIGTAQVYVDGIQEIYISSQDFRVIRPFCYAPFCEYRFVGGTTNGEDIVIEDYYHYINATGIGDFLGDCEVFRYQANTNSATPDTGDALDYGDPNALWQEVGTTPGDADEIGYADYPLTGAVYTDDAESGKHYRHGPHGDGNIDGTIKGGKWLHQLRGVGAGDYYKRYGNDGDGLTDVMTELTTAYQNYFTVSELATVVPLATEHFALGIKNIDERKDLRCKGLWAFILHVPSVGGVVVTPPTATLAISTFAPSILLPVLATPGTPSLSLATFTPILGLSVIPPPLTLSLTPFAPTVMVTANVLVTPGIIALSLMTFAPTVSAPRLITPAAIGLSITTFVPTVTATVNVTVIPSTLSLSLVPFAPTISTPRLLTPPTATLSLAAFAPTVSAPRLVTPAVASLSITAFAPTVTATANVLITPGTIALSLTTFAPTVTATANVTVIPGVLVLSLTTFAPAVTVTGDIIVIPPPLALSLTTFAPTISTPRLVTPEIVNLPLTLFAPTVTTTGNIVVTPSIATLSITAFAPTVTATANIVVTPSILALSLTAFAPTVTATANVIVTPGVLTLSLGLFAPAVSTPRVVTPGLVALSLMILTPTITVTVAFAAVWFDSGSVVLLLVLDGSVSLSQAVNDETISIKETLDGSVSLPQAVNDGTISIKETEDATI